jgi:hypothetical protein
MMFFLDAQNVRLQQDVSPGRDRWWRDFTSGSQGVQGRKNEGREPGRRSAGPRHSDDVLLLQQQRGVERTARLALVLILARPARTIPAVVATRPTIG